jgi:hypothetical protein
VHAPGEADLNLYAYVHGRVYAATDPLGLAEDPVAAVSFVADGISATDAAGQNVSAAYTAPEAPLPGPVALPQPTRRSSFEATVDNRLTRDMKHAMRFPATCNAPLHVPDQGVGNYGFQLDPALTVGLGTQAVAAVGPVGAVFSQEGGMLFTRDGAQPYLTLGGDGKMGGLAGGLGATSPVTGVGAAISETLNITLAFDRASVPGASTQAADLKGAAYPLRNHGKLDWRVDAWGLNVGAGASLSPAPSFSLSIGPSLGTFLGAVDQRTVVAP